MNAPYDVEFVQKAVKVLRKEAGRWIKERREARGLTQRDLADKLNERYTGAVSNVEIGAVKIQTDALKKWADALQYPLYEFAKHLLQFYDPCTFAALYGGKYASPADIHICGFSLREWVDKAQQKEGAL